MSQVDPFVIDIPKKFQEDPEVLEWARYLHRWCHDMWVRSGGYEDGVEQITDAITGTGDGNLPENSDGDQLTAGDITNPDEFWIYVSQQQ